MARSSAITPLEESKQALCAADREAVVAYARAEKSSATRRAYASDFLIFEKWCRQRQLNSLPAEGTSVAAFIAYEAQCGLKPSTLGRRVAAIRYAHKLAGFESPTDIEAVKATARGIRRTHGTAPDRKAPVTADIAKAMVALAPEGLAGLRDRALLLLGFSGAFRRSELVALNVVDLQECEDGLRIVLGRSKTDQEGQGVTIGIISGGSHCPVRAVKAWLCASGITEGPVFRAVRKGGRVARDRLTDKSVADIVKRYAVRLGLDPASFAGHSLRSGFLTSAAANGASIFKMMDVSRHKSVDTLRGYVREAEIFRDHAGKGLL